MHVLGTVVTGSCSSTVLYTRESRCCFYGFARHVDFCENRVGRSCRVVQEVLLWPLAVPSLYALFVVVALAATVLRVQCCSVDGVHPIHVSEALPMNIDAP